MANPPIEDVAKWRRFSGAPTRTNGALDHGVPGQYYDSHAELKAEYLRVGNSPLAVTQTPCETCLERLTYQAVSQGRTIMLSAPDGMYMFHPTADLEYFPYSDEFNDGPPSAEDHVRLN